MQLIARDAVGKAFHHVPDNGKAEIVDGELVRMSPIGAKPDRAAVKIVVSLSDYEERIGGGYAFSDNVGFLMDLPNCESVNPDAARYVGVFSADELDFLQGALIFCGGSAKQG
jgi:Uma2 family endonuclease